jgi:hypothetical protein
VQDCCGCWVFPFPSSCLCGRSVGCTRPVPLPGAAVRTLTGALRPRFAPAKARFGAGAGFILRVNVVVPATAYCENFRPLLPVDALPSDALSDRQLEVNCDAMLKGIARIARRDRGLAKLH